MSFLKKDRIMSNYHNNPKILGFQPFFGYSIMNPNSSDKKNHFYHDISLKLTLRITEGLSLYYNLYSWIN